MKWSFSFNSFVKFHSKNFLELQHDCVISRSMLYQCVIKGLLCTRTYIFAMFDVCKNDKIPFFISLHMNHVNIQPTLLHFQCQNLMFENQLTLFLILKTPLPLPAEK